MFPGMDLLAWLERPGPSHGVSKRAGFSRSAPSKLESGDSAPTLETLLKLTTSAKLPPVKFLHNAGLFRK
jgi:transcriptional regulator with XRE-family HTH domain